jgi:hypothetical protein
MSDTLNNPDPIPCSSIESPKLSTHLSTSEPIRKSPRALLVESSGPVQNDRQGSAPNNPRLETQNRRSPTAFETARSPWLPTALLSVITLVAIVGLFIFTAVWPIFATLFPVFARYRHSYHWLSLLVLRSNPADFLAVSENSCDPLMSDPPNVRRSFPRLAVESTEQISIPPDLALHHEVTPALYADSSTVVRTSEPRLSDPRSQATLCSTEIADTTNESATWHAVGVIATNPSTNPRISRCRSRSLPCASSLT